MRLALTVAVAGSMLLLAGCSWNKPKATPAPPGQTPAISAPTTAQPAVAPPAADPRTALLAISDLPTGWSIDNSPTDDGGSTPACLKNVKTSFRAAKHADIAFVKGTTSPALQQSVGTYSTAEDATAGFARGTTLLDACKDVSFKANDGTKVTGSIGAMSYPATADRSKAWSITLASEGINFGIDVVVFQQGATLGEIVLLDLGSVETDELTTFVDKAVSKASL